MPRSSELRRVAWRLTFPDGHYAVTVTRDADAMSGGAVPGPPSSPVLTYQWFLLGLLRVMAGEENLTHAYNQRWLAVSGSVVTWRRVCSSRLPEQPSIEERLHRWPSD